jgi:Papain family cysteine protease
VLLNPGALCNGGSLNGRRLPVQSCPNISTLDALKSALVAQQFVGLAHDWYESWFTPAADGTLPKPDSVAGGHMFRISGFSDSRGALHVANSWGTGWGVKGYCWLPYAYLTGRLEAYTQIASQIDVNVPFTDQGADVKTATPKTNIRAIAEDGSTFPIAIITTVRKGILGGAHPGPAHSFLRADGSTGYVLDRNFNLA